MRSVRLANPMESFLLKNDELGDLAKFSRFSGLVEVDMSGPVLVDGVTNDPLIGESVEVRGEEFDGLEDLCSMDRRDIMLACSERFTGLILSDISCPRGDIIVC